MEESSIISRYYIEQSEGQRYWYVRDRKYAGQIVAIRSSRIGAAEDQKRANSNPKS